MVWNNFGLGKRLALGYLNTVMMLDVLPYVDVLGPVSVSLPKVDRQSSVYLTRR